MKKSCLLGVFYACVIAFVSTSANAAEGVAQNTSKYGAEDIPVHSIVTGVYQANRHRNDTLSSSLLDTAFIISCGVVGIFLLRKATLCPTLITRQSDSRRFDRAVEFPLTDSQGLFVVKDRRRLSDRRKAEHGINDLKAILSKLARKKAA
jgi:hypothetical protein